MNRLLQDFAQAWRVVRRSPGFTFVSVFMLAVGIGATTAIFSLVNSVLLHPLPTHGLDRLVVIREDLPEIDLYDADLAPAEVVDLAAMEETFDAVAGFEVRDRTLTGFGEPIRVSVARTLGSFDEVFRIRPHIGIFYSAQHSTDGPSEVAVVSYGLSQQISGGNPSLLGRAIELNGVPHEVIGVMPRDFRYPRQVQIWTPFQYTDRWKNPRMRGTLIMTAVARLQPSLSPEQLAAHLQAQVNRWDEQYAFGGAGKVLQSVGFVEYLAGPLRPILLLLLGAAVFVLLIISANLASLQLVRATRRSKELAVRAAIGAARGRLMRQLLIESALLGVAGGVLGIVVGRVALDLMAAWAPAQQMHLSDIRLDRTVLGFGAVTVLFAMAVFATVPALRVGRASGHEALRESTRTWGGRLRHRLLKTSVVVQVALALVLLLGSALMIRTLSNLLAADLGFTAENVVTAQVSIPGTRYNTGEKAVGFFDALLEEIRGLPGIESAALVWGLPFTDQNDSSPFEILGRAPAPGEPERHAEARIVSPGYFSTMGIPLLRGRDFDGTEQPGSPLVIVIDQTFAQQFFPNEDPIGKQIRGYFGEPATIVGVVGRVDHDDVGDAPKAVAYHSYRHQYWSGWRSIVVRSNQPPAAVASMLRSAVARLDPNVPLYDVRTMEDRVEQSLGARRLALLALGGFAALALLLSLLGVYTVTRYATEQRKHELAVRLAVGARPGDLVWLVVRQGMATVGVGLLFGVVAALALVRVMQGIVFGVSPHDPVAFLAAAALLGAAALLATWAPAHRTARIDPNASLRTE